MLRGKFELAQQFAIRCLLPHHHYEAEPTPKAMTMKVATLLFIICLSLVSSSVSAAVSFDEKVNVVVQTQNGKVAWSKVVEAVSKEVGADIPLLGEVPIGELDIKAPSTRLMLYGANKMLQPIFRISINRRNETVIVRVNKTEIEAALDQLGKQLRADADEADVAAGRVFGLSPFREDGKLEKAEHIVLLVHGFNSTTGQMSTLAKAIEKDLQKNDSRTEVACFDYASHHGISVAAASLEKALQTVIDKNPNCSISLVTHSMGGIVSRVMIEKKGFAMAQIKRLIMVAPPNHGTQLASLPFGNASLDSLLEKIDQTGIRQALQTVVSMANIAIEDLRPDSECLKDLNSSDRNDKIDYSIILGDRGVLANSQTNLLKQVAQELSEEKMDNGGTELNSLLKTLPPELLTGKGDGVVSVESGKLNGVSDTVVMSFQHSELLKDGAKSQGKIIRQILRRLKPSEKTIPSK